MKTVFHKKFQRFVHAQKDTTLVQKIKKSVDLIIQDINIGKHLEHPFRKYKIQTVYFIYKKKSYRIAYTHNKKTKTILFLLIDSRENFYEKLKHLI